MSILYPKSREDWLALRQKYVSSTESSALFGLSKYQTAFELAMVKAGKVGPEFAETERTTWGKLLERTIATQYAQEAGVRIRSMSAYFADDTGRMGASYDFEIVGESGDSLAAQLYRARGPGVLEIKNVDRGVFRDEWHEDEAPEHIEVQVQHQLECCGREWAIIAVLVGGNHLEPFIRMRDREVGAALRRRIAQFWRELAENIYPAPDLPIDLDVLSRLYCRAQSGKVLDALDNIELANICAEYVSAAEIEKKAKYRKDVCKGMLLPLIGDHERVLGRDFTITCGEVGETEIAAYTRKGYRQFRINPIKRKGNEIGVEKVRDRLEGPGEAA